MIIAKHMTAEQAIEELRQEAEMRSKRQPTSDYFRGEAQGLRESLSLLKTDRMALAKRLRKIVDEMKVHPQDAWTVQNLGEIIF